MSSGHSGTDQSKEAMSYTDVALSHSPFPDKRTMK